jgi:hypothetical protein
MKARAFVVFISIALMTFSLPVLADFWSDAKRTIGDVGTAGWKITTAPYEAVANTVQVIGGGQSPSSIFDPYQDAGRATGDAVQNGYSLVNQPQQFMYSKVQEFANKSGGDAGSFVFDVATFNQNLMAELGTSGVNSAANVLRRQNPLQIVAAPLAGAIRAARNKHYSNSSALPDDVKKGLANVFPDHVLNRARYVVGRVDITLPNFIGRGHKFMGDDYAVVVDDVIVFNTQPPSFSNDPFWWAHEIRHVAQYGELGIEKFSWDYVRDLGGSIEGDADRHGAQASGSRIPIARTASFASQQLGVSTNLVRDAQSPVGSSAVGFQPEFFVARCHFPGDPSPVQYLLTNTQKIIAVDPISGQWMQVGWAAPPMVPGSVWTYQTMNFWYAVSPDGRIVAYPQPGVWVNVGYVQSLL